MAELHGLAAAEQEQAGRQLVRARHPRPAHEHRDHPHAAGQRRLDLQPHKITGIIQTPTVLIGGREPAIADHREQHCARLDRVGNDLGELITWLDRVHILEHPISAETRS